MFIELSFDSGLSRPDGRQATRRQALSWCERFSFVEDMASEESSNKKTP